jgi:hypothetical protein
MPSRCSCICYTKQGVVLFELPIPAWRIVDFSCGAPGKTEAGEDMKKFLEEWKGALLLGGSFLAGAILVALSRTLGWEWDKGFFLELGQALIIAPIIARGIELWMTRRIAQDVFRAAFGYSMPDHFKEEIKRIADQKLICIRHRMYVRIQPLDHDTVRVTTCVERTIKNIGPGSEYLPGIVHMDDWGFPEPSKVIRGSFSCAGERAEIGASDIKHQLDSTVKANIPQPIHIPKGESASTIVEFSEIRRTNDSSIFVFKTPTENPVIHLTLPDGLDGIVEAGIPGSADSKSVAIPGQYEFVGVYFPPAQMRVRWWPQAQAALQELAP